MIPAAELCEGAASLICVSQVAAFHWKPFGAECSSICGWFIKSEWRLRSNSHNTAPRSLIMCSSGDPAWELVHDVARRVSKCSSHNEQTPRCDSTARIITAPADI